MRVACLWFAQPAPVLKLAELFLRFSPQICVRTDQAIFVEIGKCRNLYSESSFLARAAILLRRNGFDANIRIGNDISDALALARSNVESIDCLPLKALLDFTDPFERDEVLRKSVSQIVDSFRDLGITSLAQFKMLPVSELISRFGVVGRFCHQRVTFDCQIGRPLWKPEETILEKTDFPHFEFYGELEPVLFELKSQVDRIFARLHARQRRATKLQVEIKCEKLSTHPRFLRIFDFNFHVPQSSPKGTLRILKERLAREFEKEPIKSQIESVQTKILKTAYFESSQKNIFNNDEEKFEQLHSIHNQLVELLGKENIFQAELVADRRPERSWSKRFDAPHSSSVNAVEINGIIPERSTYLCRKPLRIEVTAGYVHIRKRRYRILNWDNQVEKISGGWFEMPSADIKETFDRNYYQVEIEGHQRISVFETPSREYYLHGYYG